jgi:hypothetical protein
VSKQPVKTTSRTRATVAQKKKTESDAKQSETVKKILANFERKLKGKDVKGTLGDYIRLIQLQKELDEQATSEIKVGWVETKTEEDSKSESDG